MKRYAADLVAVVGLAALVYGVEQLSSAAAWIVGGAALLAIGIRQAWIQGRSAR